MASQLSKAMRFCGGVMRFAGCDADAGMLWSREDWEVAKVSRPRGRLLLDVTDARVELPRAGPFAAEVCTSKSRLGRNDIRLPGAQSTLARR